MQFTEEKYKQAHELRLAVTCLVNLADSLDVPLIPYPETQEQRLLREFVSYIANLNLANIPSDSDRLLDLLHDAVSQARDIIYPLRKEIAE